MATLKDFYHGARPKTLNAAIAPVLIGSSLAIAEENWSWITVLACLIVSLALQVGVNYANDYSDGIKGTDEKRVGPIRLVGQKIASPKSVLIAALASFGVAGVAGIYVASQSSWWLIAVGAACIALAWFYTGSKHPYGYYGFGELSVFICFGLVATVGTYFANTNEITAVAIVASFIPGMYSVMILLANNIRDIVGDTEAGKKTLAVRMGRHNAQALYLLAATCVIGATAGVGIKYPLVFIALIFTIPLVLLVKKINDAKIPPDYIKVLILTSKLMLLHSLVVSILIIVGRNS